MSKKIKKLLLCTLLFLNIDGGTVLPTAYSPVLPDTISYYGTYPQPANCPRA